MLVDSQGRKIALGQRIAAGGEGEVFALAGAPDTVVKLFHANPTAEKVAKLKAMAVGTNSELTKLTCWPKEILTDRVGGQTKGFLMPNAGGSKEVHLLYSPKSRANEFASVQWQFLIATASNIARAFAVVHSHGHVIGDVNHSSVMIAPDATVRLIDCDSFQIKSGSRIYRCEVGEPGHTAPELQRKKLAEIDRTPNHDNFGLAVLVFELLFMGRHPFAGQYSGPGDVTLEEKIARFLFAYGPGAAGRSMRQPPYTLPLEAVTPRVASMFEAAFGPQGPSARPTAADWVLALDNLKSETKQCSTERGHFFYKKLAQCPWCPIEAKLGFSLFVVKFAPAPTNPGFNLALVWESISKVQAPSSVPSLLPADQIVPTVPGHDFLLAGAKRKKCLLSLVICLAATICFGLLCFPAVVIPLFATIFVGFNWMKLREDWFAKRSDAQSRVDRLKHEYQQVASTYQHWTDGHLFQDAKKDLESLRLQLTVLPSEKDKVIAELRSHAEGVLRRQFLNKFQIRPGVIPGFGASRCADLQSFNIDTAADIEWHRVLQVPGVGESRASDLLRWRQSVESGFRFDPRAIVNTNEYKKMESDFALRQSQLEFGLIGGERRLRDIAGRSETQRISLYPQIQTNLTKLSEALADLRAL